MDSSIAGEDAGLVFVVFFPFSFRLSILWVFKFNVLFIGLALQFVAGLFSGSLSINPGSDLVAEALFLHGASFRDIRKIQSRPRSSLNSSPLYLSNTTFYACWNSRYNKRVNH